MSSDEENKQQEVTSAEAERVLKEEKEKRVAKCRQELDATLERNRCRLDVAMLLTQKGASPVINIIPQ
jgi:hypothetical protein